MSRLSKRAAINELQALVAVIIAAGLGYTLTTTFVDGTDGTGTVQFVFLDADGEALTAPITGRLYFSGVATGLSSDAVGTSVAVLTNGSVDAVTALTSYDFITTATGLLGLTIGNGAADSIWAVFAQPDGSLLISDEMAITGP